MPATVRVRGEAAIRVEPDEALLMITLTALKDKPGVALADVSARSTALVAMLDRLGVAKTDRATTGATVHEEFDYRSGTERSVGHRAVNQLSVRVSDHELIGRLVTEATEELSAQIDGPHWRIARTNPARLQAAREAAADARRRAQAYAEGVGVRLGEPLKLSEDQSHRVPVRAHRMATAVAAAGGGAEQLPIEPGEQEVVAAVQVTFGLEFYER